jgi:hypothetical protein
MGEVYTMAPTFAVNRFAVEETRHHAGHALLKQSCYCAFCSLLSGT